MHNNSDEKHISKLVSEIKNGDSKAKEQLKKMLYDNVYAFVFPIYKDEQRCSKITSTVLDKYVNIVPKRKTTNIVNDSRLFALYLIYSSIIKKNGDLYVKSDNMSSYEYDDIQHDHKFTDICKKYADAFENVSSYESKQDNFKNIKAKQMILIMIYGYIKLSVKKTASFLKTDEDIIRNELSQIRAYMLSECQVTEYDEKTEQTEYDEKTDKTSYKKKVDKIDKTGDDVKQKFDYELVEAEDDFLGERKERRYRKKNNAIEQKKDIKQKEDTQQDIDSESEENINFLHINKTILYLADAIVSIMILLGYFLFY